MTGALLVIAPHPDDELLGAGAIMKRATLSGQRVGVIVLTDGSRSDAGVDPVDLAAMRRDETRSGLIQLLGDCPPVLFLDKTDGTLDAASIELSWESALGRFVADLSPTTILVTDPADAHPDHKAAFGLATRLISAGHGRVLQVMPIGQRIDGAFDPVGYDVQPAGEHADAKRAALECHRSQIYPVSGFALSHAVRDDFATSEYLCTAYDRDAAGGDAIGGDHFDAMFDKAADPWGYDDTPYERDRFARTVAALAGRHYAAALELGCANGALTAQLAPLCDRLLATDISVSALAAARRRVGALPNVTLERRTLPHDVPTGPFDLIVASDMLYYLGLEGVVSLIGRLVAQASPDCRLLIASYLGHTETRLTGEMSSETAIAHLPGWRRVHAERTDRLRIDVLDRS